MGEVTQKHHTQESQEVSPSPAGDRNAAMNRQESMTNTKHKQQIGSTTEAPPWNGTIKYHTWPRTPYGKVTKHNKTSHTREPRG